MSDAVQTMFIHFEATRVKAFTTKDSKDTKEKRRKSVDSFSLGFAFVSLLSLVVNLCF
jgi:hypothetical protein